MAIDHEAQTSPSNGADGHDTFVDPAAPRSVHVPAMVAPLLAGRYEIRSLVGRGGMGSVFRAWDTMLEEEVALKLLDGALDEELLGRLRQEVKLARRVTHPNVVRTFDMGIHEDTPFLTMELVEGEPLSTVLKRDGALSLERFYAVARAVCEGLAAAHAVSVLHLDLKPGNVLLGADGRIAVSDFGVACLVGTALSTHAGTPAYMAPEQLAGGVVDTRTDVYSLGVLFYVALTCRFPSSASSAADVGLPQSVAFLVLRCLSSEPGLRYASAAQVLAEVMSLAPPTGSVRSLRAASATERTERTPNVLARAPVRGGGGRARRAIDDPVALESFTRGRIAYQKLWPEYAREAVAHFDLALQRCPDHSVLLAAGALALLRLHLISGEPGCERAQQLAHRAAELDPDLPHAQLALATLAMSDGDEVAAVAPLKAALTLAPWLGEAHARLGELLADIGEVDRALGELAIARDLDPSMEDPRVRRGQLHALLGDFKACDVVFGARSDADENLSMHAWRRVRTIVYGPTAARIAQMRADMSGLEFPLRYVIEAVLTMIETRELPNVLEAVLAQMTSPGESPRRTWFYTTPFVDALAYIGRADDALARLEHADRHGLIDLLWLDQAPTLARLRTSAGFLAVRSNARARAERLRHALVHAGLL